MGNASNVGTRRPPPALIPQWRATVHMIGGTYIFNNTWGVFQSDSTNKRFRLTITTHTDVFSLAEQQVTDFLLKDVKGDYLNVTVGSGRGTGAVCHPYAQPGTNFDDAKGDPFWWLPHSEFSGFSNIGGERCSCFRFLQQEVDGTMCFDRGGLPRFLGHNPKASLLSVASGAFGSFFIFSNVTAGTPADDAFAPSQACAAHFPLPLCPQSTNDHDGVVKLNVYRIQGPHEPLELANRNSGDALGDMLFTCGTGTSGGAGRLIVRYVVMANSSWGQFNQCQYDGVRNYCTGTFGREVGRGTPEGLGGKVRGGQCTDNLDVGSWYSFPKEGQCRDGEPVGSHGCTWSARLARVVDARCVLVHRGLLEACTQEQGHPAFRNATAIFVKALASEDPSRGGCPSVAEFLV
mmetsp:Transcript_32612/g.75782  ORF Transcript_32612/g.75782 Transcript_32612/m.75782 type:complete len:405 (-) Transcript_32612:135-1349(-)